MADATASWAMSFQDQISPGASGAADALQKLKGRLDEDTAALSQMQRAMRQMQQGTVVNVAAVKQLREQIAAKKAAVADATSQYVKMGGTFQKVAPQIQGSGKGLKGFADMAKASGSPLGAMLGRIQGVTKALAPGGLAAAAALGVIAVAALAVAVVAAAAKLAQLVISASDAARSQRLLYEALTGSQAGAEALGGAVSRVSANVAIGSDEVSGYAKQLYQAGLRGGQLEAALEAASISAATLGKDAASAFIDKAKAVRNVSGAVEKLSGDIKGKLGGVAAKQMLSLDVQSRKLKESIGQIFASAAIEPFLRAVKSITSMFSENAATGAALRQVVSAIFDPFFKSTESGAPIVKALIQGITIGVLYLTIAFLKVRNAVRDLFGGEFKTGIDWANVAMYAGIAVVGALAIGLGALGLALAGVATMAMVLVAPFLLAGAAIMGAIWLVSKAIEVIPEAIGKAIEWIKGIDFGQLATDIINGLVNGLKNGAGLVGDALKNVAKNALGAFKGVFGIASPSKVMMEMGGFLGEGAALGIEESSSGVEGAMSDMVSIPAQADAGMGDEGGTSIANTSSSSNVITINITAGGGDSEGIADAVKRALAEVLEGAAITMGAPA